MTETLLDRTCEDCNKCCEGYLSAEIHGHIMDLNTPCKFLDKELKRCSIYSNRPVDPCQEFLCEWRTNREVYPWFKPSYCGLIMIREYVDDYEYLAIIDAGETVTVDVLNWAIEMVNTGKIENICYQLYGRWNYVSMNQDWIDLMRENED